MSGEKYLVDVIQAPEGLKASSESLQALKGVVGRKMIINMQKEAVNCPVLKQAVAFPDCMACPNFIRRVRGKVYCRGEPLGNPKRSAQCFMSFLCFLRFLDLLSPKA